MVSPRQPEDSLNLLPTSAYAKLRFVALTRKSISGLASLKASWGFLLKVFSIGLHMRMGRASVLCEDMREEKQKVKTHLSEAVASSRGSAVSCLSY